jgi:hypothetical protein
VKYFYGNQDEWHAVKRMLKDSLSTTLKTLQRVSCQLCQVTSRAFEFDEWHLINAQRLFGHEMNLPVLIWKFWTRLQPCS